MRHNGKNLILVPHGDRGIWIAATESAIANRHKFITEDFRPRGKYLSWFRLWEELLADLPPEWELTEGGEILPFIHSRLVLTRDRHLPSRRHFAFEDAGKINEWEILFNGGGILFPEVNQTRSLREIEVTYSNGVSEVVSLAAHLTDEQSRGFCFEYQLHP